MRFLKEIIGRLRGNPDFLATLVVSFIALILAFISALAYTFFIDTSFDETKKIGLSAFIGATFGVFLAFFLDMIRRIFGSPDLREVPMDIAEGARNEVFDAGYYRRNCKIAIEFENEKEAELKITLDSDIFVISDRSLMKYPDIGTEAGCREQKDSVQIRADYRHNGTLIHQVKISEDSKKGSSEQIRLRGCEVIHEQLRVFRSQKDKNQSKHLEDGVHRWTSAVSGGLTVEARLPDQYQFQVFALVGSERVCMREKENIGQTESPSKKTFTYIYDDSFFSQQGIKWEIKPLD